jgi:hypothetical protein
MQRVGIIGNGADKFTAAQAACVKDLIRSLLSDPRVIVVVSGRSPMGGVDLWAEEIAGELGITLDIKAPRVYSWSDGYGYRARNLDIARASDVVHVIVARMYPAGYSGRRFGSCYHCRNERPPHVKSGACWTAKQALALGKEAVWHIIEDNGVARHIAIRPRGAVVTQEG